MSRLECIYDSIPSLPLVIADIIAEEAIPTYDRLSFGSDEIGIRNRYEISELANCSHKRFIYDFSKRFRRPGDYGWRCVSRYVKMPDHITEQDVIKSHGKINFNWRGTHWEDDDEDIREAHESA